MAPPQRTCVVCHRKQPNYACASCRAKYCSVACYTQHKETCSSAHAPDNNVATTPQVDSESGPDTRPKSPDADAPLQDPSPLRPLTSLKWPYVPDTSAYPDPLTRDDPKPLQLPQYEALATSSTVRTILRSNPRLCDHLMSINALRGAEREEALQRALGVDSRQLKNDGTGSKPLDDDTKAFRAFVEAVEIAVRGGREDMLGLDWD